MADIVPAIWFKLRSAALSDVDREYVLLIRQLGYYLDELEEVTQQRTTTWQSTFETIRRNTDPQAPPREQGRLAARFFRASHDLGKGATGIGEVFRGHMRSLGILVIETPIPKSALEGCCFYVGPSDRSRPCVFTNSHRTTWFRRNEVIAHELCHSIFDAESNAVVLDWKIGIGDSSPIVEERAEAFAQELLIPREVLRHTAMRERIRWNSLTDEQLAKLIAETHVEARTVLTAALDNGCISEQERRTYTSLEPAQHLRRLSTHARTTGEFLKTVDPTEAKFWLSTRDTTSTMRRLRLPVRYVASVLDAVCAGEVSRGKAAELLMIDEDTFDQRFSELCPAEVE